MSEETQTQTMVERVAREPHDKTGVLERLGMLAGLGADAGGENEAAPDQKSISEAMRFVDNHEFLMEKPLPGLDHNTGAVVLEFHGKLFGSICFLGRGIMEVYINDGQKSDLFTAAGNSRKARNILTRIGVHEISS